MVKKMRSTVFVMFVAFLVSCSVVQNTETGFPTASSIAATKTLHPTRVPIVAATGQIAFTEVATAVSLPLNTIEQRCVTIEKDLHPGFLTNGQILLAWEYEWLNFKTMSLTTDIVELNLLPDLPIDGGSLTSPDGNWLAYSTESKLMIHSADGKLMVSRPWHKDWGFIHGWLDSERLIFWGPTITSNVLYIYNPFTQQEVVFTPNITDRYEYDREWSGWFVWKFVPDATLTRIAYVRALGRAENKYRPELVLSDLENGETLWKLERFSPGERLMPVWSPDGSRMAVISDDYQSTEDTYRWEVFTVDQNGQAIQWLDVRAESLIGTSGWVQGLEWSPNGRYIAFFAESLYVLDTESQQVFDFCIPSGQWDRLPTHVITWAPDSTQILFQRGDSPTVAIDLESNRSAMLVDDVNIRPIGWLTSIP